MLLSRTLLICLCLYFIMISCGSETTFTVEIIDGVRMVHNLKPMYEGDSKISLEFVRQIGELDGDNENLQFYNPDAIDFDVDGNMYILDRGNYRIQKLDKDGNYILTIGRKGQGPGEFENPRAIKILDDNTLLVSDRRNYNLQSFSLTGELLNTIPFKVYYFYIHIFENGNLMFNYDAYEGDTEENTFLAGVFDQELNVLQKFGAWEKSENQLRNILGNIVGFTSNDGGNKYVTFLFRNKLLRFNSEGVLDLEFNKKRSFEETEEPESQIREEDGRRIGIMKANEMYTRAILDNKNRLWIISTNVPYSTGLGESDVTGVFNMDIYDEDGILLQSIPWDLGYSRRPIFVKNDRMYFIDTNEMSIFEYKIVEKE